MKILWRVIVTAGSGLLAYWLTGALDQTGPWRLTMSVFAALCTASTPPQRDGTFAAPAAKAAPASSSPTARVKSPKPIIMTTVAAAAGIDNFKIDHVSAREIFDQRIGW